jgi:circadian clock protein KaiC
MEPSLERCSSGVSGLDSLLNGGLIANRLFLVIGQPGTGKTLLGTHFLREGLDNGEDVLFIHGEESKEDILANVSELGIDLSDAKFLDIGPESQFFTQSQTYDVVNPQDVDEDDPIGEMREAIEQYDPDRVLIDPISQLHHIEPNEYQFQKRSIAFTRFLKDNETTVMATMTPNSHGEQNHLRSLSDGVIAVDYDEEGRRIRIPKHRGVAQEDGTHGLEIREDGVDVYPALRPNTQDRTFDPDQLPSGIENLDSLLDGGLERGTVTVITGPSGIGKSTTATEFLQTAAENGDSPIAYLFEESIELFSYRAQSFDIPVTELREAQKMTVEEIPPLTFSPEEFGDMVKRQVQAEDADLVVIDGLKGYRSSIKGGAETIDLQERLHALTRYLVNQNVTVILIDEHHEVTGLTQPTGSSISYLADNLLYEKFRGSRGEFQRIVGVLKKRVGAFETTPRQFEITSDGLDVGNPLTELDGVLDTAPDTNTGSSEPER